MFLGTTKGNVKTVVKTVNEDVTNSAVLQDDDELFIALKPNEKCLIDVYLIVSSAAVAPHIKFTLTAPGSTVIQHFIGTDAGSTIVDNIDSAFPANGRCTTTGYLRVKFEAIVICGAVADTAVVQWAQNTAGANKTTVHANSCLIKTRLN